MKKLVLYFLYFVGFALILIQCAKLFPTQTKSNKQQLKSRSGTGLENRDSPERTTAIFTYTSAFTPGLTAGLVREHFLNYDIAPYLNNRRLFYAPTTVFGYNDLFRSYNSGLIVNK
jgi:hypothetical protein